MASDLVGKHIGTTCFDVHRRTNEYIWKSIKNIWIKITDCFDFQSTLSFGLSPVDL